MSRPQPQIPPKKTVLKLVLVLSMNTTMKRNLFPRADVLAYLAIHGPTGTLNLHQAMGARMKLYSFCNALNNLQAQRRVRNLQPLLAGTKAVWAVVPEDVPEPASPTSPAPLAGLHPGLLQAQGARRTAQRASARGAAPRRAAYLPALLPGASGPGAPVRHPSQRPLVPAGPGLRARRCPGLPARAQPLWRCAPAAPAGLRRRAGQRPPPPSARRMSRVAPNRFSRSFPANSPQPSEGNQPVASKKMKAPAFTVSVPQSRGDCALHIKKLGDVQRQFERSRAEMNDAIAHITERYQPVLELLDAQCQALAQGIQTWCEANRATLCENGGKTANLVTGEVSWRQRPPSVRVTGADSVIEFLKCMGLERFVRTKEEVNKDAILNEQDAVRGIAGISIVSGVEDFAIAPTAVDVEVQS